MSRHVAAPQRLRAAFVRRAHGVRGEVRVEPFGGGAGRFQAGTKLGVEAEGRSLTVRSARDGGDGSVLLAFDEIPDAEAAEQLRGAYLDVAASAARSLPPDEWFTWQLVGLEVRSTSGAPLGVVDDVEASVANDVLVVRNDAGLRRYPMVRAFVRDVDLQSGVLVLDPQDEVQA